MLKISLCMIVKDEEEVLARCLESAKPLADEIVIVDTGSSDATPEIAARYTDRIFSLPWRDDFSLARNYALSKATGDYLIWLDADDVLSEEAHTRIGELRAFLERENPDMVFCPYVSGALRYERERFLRRDANLRFVGRVHEAIPPRGKTVRFPFPVLHLSSAKDRSRRNLDLYLKWAEEEPLSPRDLFYYGRELYYHRLYTEAAAVLERMLKNRGWYVNQIAACETLSRCYEALGEEEKALHSLFMSFLYGEPRAFVLCRIGEMFLKKKAYAQAAFWYESAMRCRDHTEEGDFEEPACRYFTPLLQLTVCYWRLGDREHARACHIRTEELAPDHPSVRFNRQFFGE